MPVYNIPQSQCLSFVLFLVKDLVLLVDSGCHRGQWPMAIVGNVFPDEHGTVRQVIIETRSGKFRRDVRKLCMLEETKIDGDQ